MQVYGTLDTRSFRKAEPTWKPVADRPTVGGLLALVNAL
jgi:hypothetical protein